MTLQDGPEADARHPHPKVDDLPSFDVTRLLKMYVDPDRTIFVDNVGSRTTVTEDTGFTDDNVILGNEHEQKQPCRVVQVKAGEGFSEGWCRQMKQAAKGRPGLMSAEEELVEESAEGRQREQNNQPY